MKNAVIIGSGISGAVSGRLLAENGYKVTIIERREHIAGNLYDYLEDGILTHKYGPHLLHTNIERVIEFLKRFTTFFPYEHRVLGEINGKLVPIPFNFKSIDELFSKEVATELKEVLTSEYGEGKSMPIMELRKNKNEKVQELAEFVFKNVFYNYTKKQWGMTPEEMDPSVMGRVPVRISYDDRYFSDRFQMMPVNGFTSIIENMLDHENISIRLNCDAKEILDLTEDKILFDGEIVEGPIIFTGCIDELLDYKYGQLPYRSLKFRLEKHNVDKCQPVPVVNYPNNYSYTRVTEMKLLQCGCKEKGKTILSYEYPMACGKNDIPYYSIANKENHDLYERYKKEVQKFDNFYLLGRLAEYKYYNIDAAMDRAFDLINKII